MTAAGDAPRPVRSAFDDCDEAERLDGISVVVATRDRSEMLDDCLASIRASLRTDDELVVVDSASRDGHLVREVALRHSALYVRCDQPGASRARNVGWRAATRGVIAFIDDDVRVRAEWASAVSRALADTVDVSFVTGMIVASDESVERPVAVFDEPLPFDIDIATPDPVGHGANHAVRRKALEIVGGFDERLGPGTTFRSAEDVDLWDRLLLAHERGRYDPTMAAWHVQWRTRSDNVTLDWAYGYGGGARLAKLLRTNRQRAAIVAKVLFWRWGLRMLYLEYRQPYKASLHSVRLAGVVAGLARGIVTPIHSSRYSSRRLERSLAARVSSR
jgi:glycosyltransferase involved in cell wall biosynthesis